ncbi:hypothetical protein [Kribbella pratensis]|uniref:MYXO-CTERM domain-containing protein n=1 Tax=Kribbella pratensis TaxID=2512112 RepID=A0A4R8CFA3_9ACTN|nr:hypothetical protein [Kribbella pratensis]TDW74948.1 hypothetical protein EV653_0054 [Kribbella pratensis]
MHYRYSALAMFALALGTVVLTTTDASAMLKDPGTRAAASASTADEWPDEGSSYPGFGAKSPEYTSPDSDPQHHGNMTTPEGSKPEYNYPEYKLDVPTSPAVPTTAPARLPAPSDDTRVELLQAGAAALGGAGLALGGLWLYRRLHAPAV